ncbi:M28 family peptidase [Marinoscillum sp. MHG1-6]|uniref:M28 family peptidase n=1 Tax=Marinoscillum sp. MHG1-6 TaxID=2959627 RepID=UPI0021586B74|nr:M28 family peptidase [Marinoscillum sp. MHG1-6]
MKTFLYTAIILLVQIGFAQKKLAKQINKEVKKEDYQSYVYFLASDEMRGRNTGTQENEIAARFIAEQFRSFGVKPVPGTENYFQPVYLQKSKAPREASVILGDSVFNLWKDMIFVSTSNVDLKAEMMFVEYGFEEDLEGKDVEGKILIAKAGNGDPSKGSYKFSLQKSALARERGALGLIELYRPSRIPWKLIVNYLSGDQFALDHGQQSKPFPSGWLVDESGDLLSYFKSKDGEEITLKLSGSGNEKVIAPNVVAYIEGTDPELKDDYILISAHLDHVGVKNVVGGEDSIWNGARDNGIGIANMINTAKYFAKHPAKRSILFLACNAEEVGLLGSQWYAEHPLIPLEKTVFNLNTDTGGYDDISKVTIVGFNRTSVTPYLVEGADMFGLEAIDDMFPEENFYDRSDNVSFAAKGVPAVSYGPGVVEMGAAITDYYHQPTDEPQTLDYDYLIKFSKAYIYTLNKIANTNDVLWWTPGDKYEEDGKKLYGKN